MCLAWNGDCRRLSPNGKTGMRLTPNHCRSLSPEFAKPLQEFVAKWQDRDETDNFFQKYDAELVKDELRPLVFEEIRLQVWLQEFG